MSADEPMPPAESTAMMERFYNKSGPLFPADNY